MKVGQTWRLGDDEGGETIATVLEVLGPECVRVLVLASTIQGCRAGTTEEFSTSWFRENGSFLS